MLNEESVPVWMLADSLLALLACGVLAAVTGLPLAVSALAAPTPQVADALHLKQSRVDLQRLNAKLNSLQQTNNDLQRDAQQADANRNTAEDTAAALKVSLSSLQSQLNSLTSERDQLKSRMLTAVSDQHKAESAGAAITRNLQQLSSQMTGLRNSSASEKSVRQELLGLKGDMSRTLFVIDISASMANECTRSYVRANWQAGENAWINVRRRIRDYLEMLPVGSFRLLCFNHALSEFPQDTARWCSLAEDRQMALQFLDGQIPNGITSTELALRRAAEFQPTTRLLFTDGQPTQAVDVPQPDGTVKSLGQADYEQQRRILKLSGDQTLKCPVNVIALNDYSDTALKERIRQITETSDSSAAPDPVQLPDQTFLEFLQELAGRSGGAFIGL